ncbi:MAG: hypothetical protein JW991_05425 [Candidatus Pacebacteria bacterium]|nr:hypothetical protein [Candidatus Paceibacterota bacterium]
MSETGERPRIDRAQFFGRRPIEELEREQQGGAVSGRSPLELFSDWAAHFLGNIHGLASGFRPRMPEGPPEVDPDEETPRDAF